MKPTDPIGAVIERLCHTREELAQQLGVSPAALYSWSVGRRSPRPSNRTELAKIARTHARELANLANLLDGPTRRSPLAASSHTGTRRTDGRAEKHAEWRRELRDQRVRAVEARLKARETISEVRKVAPPGTKPGRFTRPTEPA